MEIVGLKHKQLLRACATLRRIIEKYESAKKNGNVDPDDLLAYRDSSIKRFEFCYDLSWKFLKLLLEKRLGIIVRSPKETIHTCFTTGIISADESALFLRMVDDRNTTSHLYDENEIDVIAGRIPSYYELLSITTDKLMEKEAHEQWESH